MSEFIICPVLNVISSVNFFLPVLGSDLFLCLIYNVLCKFQSTFIDDSKSIEDAREKGHIHLSEVIPYYVHFQLLKFHFVFTLNFMLTMCADSKSV